MKARVTLSGLLLLWTLNTLDAASTHLALYLKVGTELNPLMAWAFAVSPLIFWVVKFSLVSLSTVILYRFRKERIAGPALEIMNLAFAILIGWHLISWTLYFHVGLDSL